MSTNLQHAQPQTWWHRPAGGREVLGVALPLVISSLSWTVMTFVDRMFLMWESGTAMAAAFSAATFWFALICLPLGVCMYAATFVSQYHGSAQPHRIGPAVWQAVWVALFFTPPLLLTIPIAPALFDLIGHAEAAARQETLYFQIMCWGAPAMLVGQALSAFYAGRGLTAVVMRVDTGVAVLNVVLDYLWIFGVGGFPALGIAGAAWATVVALWIKAIVYLFLIFTRSNRARFNTLGGIRLQRQLFGRLLYFGVPSGLQLVLDIVGFTVFVLFVGRLGGVEAEATTIAFSISTLAFMPIWGLGQAAGILVGQRLGENRDDLAARSTWSTLSIALSYMAGISLLYLFAPHLFLWGFFQAGLETEHSRDVYALSMMLLRFVAAYNLFDAMLMVFVSAVKGAGDTLFVLRVSLVMAILLVTCSWLAVEVWHLGIFGCWMLITAWVWTLGIVFLIRFLGGVWRKMRVIEPFPAPPVSIAAAEIG